MTVRTFFHTPLVRSTCVSLLVFCGLMALRQTGHLESLELAAYDAFIRLQFPGSKSHSRIVVIEITEEDIRALGHWPISDATMATLLAQLTQYEPRAIGLDIYRDVAVPPGHEAFNAVITSHPYIILPMKFNTDEKKRVLPPAVLSGTDQVGFIDLLVDPGGTVRRGLLFLGDGHTTHYAFALRLSLLYLADEGIVPQPDARNPSYIRLGATTLPPFRENDGAYIATDARGYQFLLDFRDNRDAFPSFSLPAVLEGKVDPSMIKDKIVLVGVTAESVKDFFYTPLSTGQQMPGVVLHAVITSQLLRSALDGIGPMRVMTEISEVVWICLWSLLGGLIGLWRCTLWRFVICVAGGGVLATLVAYGSFVQAWWIPVVPPVLGWTISAAVVTAYMSYRESHDRAALMQLFARHVSPEVADAIWQQRDEILLHGRPRSQRMVVSVLFTDLVGFTTVSEKMAPQALVNWLNEYMETMAPFVSDHQGVILQYIGDAIMAAFGVPLSRGTEDEIRRDAIHAVQCALDMRQALIQLNRRWRTQALPMIGMRIGVYTGTVVGGSIGSQQRMEYTINGDTVNTASRLEGFEKEKFMPDFENDPCRVFIGEATLRYLHGQFETHRVGAVRLKGKEQSVTVYRVMGYTRDLDHKDIKETSR